MPWTILNPMTCAICGNREAVVFMRRSGGRASGELALCVDCARQRGLSAGGGRIELRIEDLLAPLSEDAAAAGAIGAAVCAACGTEVEAFRREARIGCPACASSFRDEMESWMRARAPWHRAPARSPDSNPALTTAEPVPRVDALASELERALAAEDYENAALIRDRMSRSRGSAAEPGPVRASNSPEGSPIDAPAFRLDFPGLDLPPSPAESDVVLQTRARIARNAASGPFPGPLGMTMADSLSAAADILPVLAGGRSVTVAALKPPLRAAFVEASFFSRAYALSESSILAYSAEDPVYCIFGDSDRYRAFARVPGLQTGKALALVASVMEPIESSGGFAFDEEFGYLCSSLRDCGTGLALEAVLHLPALAQEGQTERVLRGLLVRGLQVRGSYGREEGSAGDLWEVGTDRAFGLSSGELAGDFEAAIGAVVLAERRARENLARKRLDDVLDGAGRALGLFRYGRFVGEVEAAEGLSALRLTSLLGRLDGIDAACLGRLMRALGPGMLFAAAGKGSGQGDEAAPGSGPAGEGSSGGARRDPAYEAERRDRRRGDRLRAIRLAAALAACRLDDGGGPCSRD